VAIGAALVLGAVSLSVGPSGITLGSLLDGVDPGESMILWQLRLPRLILAVISGAALSISGALMQTYFRNPLAEPYITGVSAGGALGAVVIASLGIGGIIATAGAALAGAALITAALLYLAARIREDAAMSIILLGLALGTLCGAVVWFLLLKQGPGGTGLALSWLLGRVSTVGYGEIGLMLPLVLLGVAVAWRYIPDLDALLMGEEKAASLGVNLPVARTMILGSATLLAAASVAFCGVIAFVGLMVPHVVRQLTGAVHGRLIPVAAAGGALLVVAVDILARVVDPPREIPLTIITSIIGAPFFIAVLLRSRPVRL
jgi:iron complex transport system permease protein